MKVRWRHAAVSDLAKIRDYIAESNPAAAHATIGRVLRSVDRLERFPKSGRIGRVAGTREIIVPGLPYIVVYIDEADIVDIVAVFHGSQDQP